MERFDFETTPPPLPEGQTWATFEARAREAGIWDDVLRVGVLASMAGIDAALADVTLPDWAQPVLRSQFPV